ARAQFLDAAQGGREYARPVCQRHAQQIQHRALESLQQLQKLFSAGSVLLVAHADRIRKTFEISFGVNQAKLIAARRQPLEHGSDYGGLATAGRPGNQDALPVRPERHLPAFVITAQQNGVAREAGRPLRKIGFEQLRDQFANAGAVVSASDYVGALLERFQSISNGNRAFAHAQEGVVILGIADADYVVRREAQFAQRRLQARALIDTRRQHHHRALVEDDLQLQPQLADGFDHRGLLRLPGGDDALANRERLHASFFEAAHEGLPWSFAQRRLFASSRTV